MTLFEKMTHTTYAFTTQLSHTEVLVRFSALVRVEGMRATGLVNLSASAFDEGLGIKPYMKRYRRFLGINPFAHVSDLYVQTTPHDGIATHVLVVVNQLRAWRWVPYVMLLAWILFRGQPAWLMSVSVASAAVIAWRVSVTFLGGYLIEKQVGEALAVVAPPERDS